MIELFNTVIFEPLLNALVGIYHVIPDLGIAIILLTLVIKAILFLPSRSSIVSQKKLQDMQPQLKALQNKYKDNKEEQGRQLMKFYKENKVNPLSSCLPLLIQLPILLALYRVFIAVAQVDSSTGLLVEEQIGHLYPSLAAIYSDIPINNMFLGFVDMHATGNWILALSAGAAQFFQSKMLMSNKPPKVEGSKDESMASTMSKQMTYFFPLLIIFFSLRFPAGLALYWFVATLFQLGQQYLLFKKKDDKPEVLPKSS
ncbi:YidC/Oxa1 family membrane protein insertase [Patescibacteria group bacterium]